MASTTVWSAFLALVLAGTCTAARLEPDAAAVVAPGGAGADAAAGRRPLLSADVVSKVNAGAGWTAGLPAVFATETVAQFQSRLGVPLAESAAAVAKLPVDDDGASEAGHDIPASFDSRVAWPKCGTIRNIRDQGHCGSCWAFGAVEALSDRFCVAGGAPNVSLSANDLLACNALAGSCDGGQPAIAWEHMSLFGVVTTACDPYFDQDKCHHPGCEPLKPTPKCHRKCVDGESWKGSKHYSTTPSSFGSAKAMQKAIMTDGPIEVAFTVYEDFAHYTSGVYHHVTGEAMGGHAVKAIGWGTDPTGGDYWLIANSWSTDWGESGFFRIKRGVDECGIESQAVAGKAKVKAVETA